MYLSQNILIIFITTSSWYNSDLFLSGTPGLWSCSCCRHCTAWNFIWPTVWWHFLVSLVRSDWSFVFTCTFKQRPSKLKKCLEIFLECGRRKAKNVVRKNKGKYRNGDSQISKINNIMVIVRILDSDNSDSYFVILFWLTNKHNLIFE